MKKATSKPRASRKVSPKKKTAKKRTVKAAKKVTAKAGKKGIKKAVFNNSPIQHVVIIFKENHGFDNYFGSFPGANGDPNMPHLPDPPVNDPNHTHEAWLKRATNAVKGEYLESDIPNYFALAQQFTLCDNYCTDVWGVKPFV